MLLIGTAEAEEQFLEQYRKGRGHRQAAALPEPNRRDPRGVAGRLGQFGLGRRASPSVVSSPRRRRRVAGGRGPVVGARPDLIGACAPSIFER